MPAFIDTNVLVYCTAGDAPAKRNRARALVERLSAAGEAVVSTQVLIEFFHVLTRKQKMPGAAAQALVLACTAWQVVQSALRVRSNSRCGTGCPSGTRWSCRRRFVCRPERCTAKTWATASVSARWPWSTRSSAECR